VLFFNADSARAFGSVAASLRASCRKSAARAYDALIALTPLRTGCRYSCNPADYERIPRFDLRTPSRHPEDTEA
jgi:predicted nucleic acid-binding protein